MVNTFNINDFTDLKELSIDNTKNKTERLKQFAQEVKNPYMVRVGDILIKIEFAGGKTFSDALTTAFLM